MENKNDKNIYDMLNDIEVDLSEYEREDFNDIEKMKIKKKFRASIGKKNLTKKYASVASIAVVSLIVISATPLGTYASKVISDLVFDIKTVLRIGTEEESYIKTINKSVTKDGLTLRLNEAILNDDELIVSLTTISSSQIAKDERIWREQSPKLYINGEFIDSRASGTLNQVSKNNIDEVMFFNINTSEYTGIIDVKIEISDICRYEEYGNKFVKEYSKDEPFVFEFDLDTNKINEDIKNIPIKKVINFGNGQEITLDKFVYTPLTQKIYFTLNNLAFKNEIDMILKGTDDLGNEVDFDIYIGTNESGQLIANTNKIDENTKYIKLTAYQRISINKGEEVEFKLKEIEKDIKINLIKKDK